MLYGGLIAEKMRLGEEKYEAWKIGYMQKLDKPLREAFMWDEENIKEYLNTKRCLP